MIRFPHDLKNGEDGWLSEAEGLALAAFAAGKRVLEIGSFKGKSTICMAQTAKFVSAVDPFDGRATPLPGSTLAAFGDNIRRYGLCSKVETLIGTIDQAGPELEPEYDLVFIDGAHDHKSVRNDIEWALRLLKPGGLIAFHDYRWGTANAGFDAGVEQAVNELLADGGELLCHVGSVALVRPPRELLIGVSDRKKVVLAQPNRGWSKSGRSFYGVPTVRNLDLHKLDASSSVLTLNFNRMWCDALNLRDAGFKYFAMLHDDVVAEAGWLDVLMDELDRLNADVVSAVVPIKSIHGLTSTALGWGEGGTPFRPLRRITMNELFSLPETFCRAEVPLEGPPTLFINTGCWVADLTKPWVEKNVFRNVERNKKVNGKWVAECVSEDWAFSCDLARWGAKVYATRKVPLYHERPEFHNRKPWGSWRYDEEYFPRAGLPAPVHKNCSPEASLAVAGDVLGE